MNRARDVQSIAAELREAVTGTVARLSAIGEAQAGERPAEAKWAPKEVIGHLIDSASNNHQRFVRALLEEALVFPAYEQEGWNRIQRYRAESWPELIALWAAYNRHLAHLIEGVPGEKLERHCTVGTNAPVTLAFLIEDYLRHLRHHLAQI
ncbi:MAG: DinB family protein [Bryobacteraceae bacterium]